MLLEGCFLWEEPGWDVDAIEASEARGFEMEETDEDPVPRLRVVLFPMPLFCPDRVFLAFVPIMAPGLESRWNEDMRKGRTFGGGGGSQVGGQRKSGCDIDLLDMDGRGTKIGDEVGSSYFDVAVAHFLISRIDMAPPPRRPICDADSMR